MLKTLKTIGKNDFVIDILEEILEEEIADIIDEELSIIVAEIFSDHENTLSLAACQPSVKVTLSSEIPTDMTLSAHGCELSTDVTPPAHGLKYL